MKKWVTLLSLLAIFLANKASHACPHCTGNIETQSPPFFAQEFYQPTSNCLDFDPEPFKQELESLQKN